MGILHHHSRGGKRLQRKPRSGHHSEVRLAALLLCLSMLAGFFPALARAAEDREKLSSIVTFDSITLHYADSGAAISDGDLIEKDKGLMLRYTYTITASQCTQIAANTQYYLDVSPHLALPHLESGSPLTIETGDGPVQFGKIYADGSSQSTVN